MSFQTFQDVLSQGYELHFWKDDFKQQLVRRHPMGKTLFEKALENGWRYESWDELEESIRKDKSMNKRKNRSMYRRQRK